jgi:prepilin-type N-terminal cleavage/methylation domain-containing protein
VMSLNRTDNRGFSLLEIAIVLVVIGFLVGGAVPLMSVLSEKKRRSETLDYLNEAKASLVNFAKINGRLPWADTTGDGVSDANQAFGTLPFQTLGIRPADSQGRPLRYALNNNALNNNLGTDLATSCNALRGGLIGAPQMVDSSAAFHVAAVLISGGPMDADSDGSVYDSINAGAFRGNNNTGNPNYIRNPPTNTFDDLVVYIDQYTLYGEMCGNPQLAVRNSTAANIYIYDNTNHTDIGIIAPGATVSYGITSGSQMQIRNAAGGGGAILASTPAMPTFIAGSGIGVTVLP